MEANIKHDAEDLRFYAELDGEEAELTYTYTEDDVLDMDHTFVPPSQRGKGIADQLVKAGLEFAKSQDFKIVASCPVVEAYVQRHPEYQDLVKEV
ncbi:N-acetyltransferase [Pontibacter sp. 172403-2]|uniref:GNAT family N-acetyltransferase n=1 Tax=Pontibacter rufus TaxID=2791028 RepID=UPI0018AFEFEB|nr:GNAT family N-acetyltransferase [Pontibacter sp. 172403-2]MBF9254455.1 N-acetyltransferase [Pontibacter sp. 172403-2]